MRTYTRVLASLLLGLAIVLTGLTGPATASTTVHDRSDKVISQAKKLKGKHYRWGGAGPTSFDCSGYVQYVFKKAGKKIGRTSGAQLAGKKISKSNKKPGDILVFMRGSYAYHSAIYAGHGQMWEAQRTGVPVGRHKIWSSSYVVRRPTGGITITGSEKARSATSVETPAAHGGTAATAF